jgi:hypothetical protein
MQEQLLVILFTKNIRSHSVILWLLQCIYLSSSGSMHISTLIQRSVALVEAPLQVDATSLQWAWHDNCLRLRNGESLVNDMFLRNIYPSID